MKNKLTEAQKEWLRPVKDEDLRELYETMFLNGSLILEQEELPNGKIAEKLGVDIAKVENILQLERGVTLAFRMFSARVCQNNLVDERIDRNWNLIMGLLFSVAERYHELRESGEESIINKNDPRSIVSDNGGAYEEKRS